MWFVPTAALLPAGRWAFSAYRVNEDFNQGLTDVTNIPVTCAVGLTDRLELFGAWHAVRRIDRDVRPLFPEDDDTAGGVVNQYPFVRRAWSGTRTGDLWIGAKVGLGDAGDQRLAFSLRGLVKVPLASAGGAGAGTGQPDLAADAIVSAELGRRVELTAFGGLIVRGAPAQVAVASGMRWGAGIALPARGALRLTAELHGERHVRDAILLAAPFVAEDGTMAPSSSRIDSPVNASLGLTWLTRRGLFVGIAMNRHIALRARSDFPSQGDDVTGDPFGVQIRIGYHAGGRAGAR